MSVAWIDDWKTRVSCAIPSNRDFHVFEPPSEPAEIDADATPLIDPIEVMIDGHGGRTINGAGSISAGGATRKGRNLAVF